MARNVPRERELVPFFPDAAPAPPKQLGSLTASIPVRVFEEDGYFSEPRMIPADAIITQAASEAGLSTARALVPFFTFDNDPSETAPNDMRTEESTSYAQQVGPKQQHESSQRYAGLAFATSSPDPEEIPLPSFLARGQDCDDLDDDNDDETMTEVDGALSSDQIAQVGRVLKKIFSSK